MGNKTRVVVTGLGAITPIGNDVASFWQGLKDKKVGIAPITYFDTTDYKAKLAGEVKDFDPKKYMDPKAARRMEPFSQYAVAAAGEAIAQAGLDMEKEEQMLQLLVVTPTQLCKCCLRDMYKRGSGKILNVASVGAFQPGPYTASYYASKSYLYQYSQAIRLEAKKQGVQVCTLCPGSTRTHFFEKTGAKTPIWAMSPERVAKEAWEGLNADKAVVVPGMINRLLRLVPAQIKAYGVALLKKHT